MIAIQNADGTLVQVFDGSPGSYGTVALSLVRQRQRRADIKFYFEDGDAVSRVGTMVLKKLPDNTFGEAEIALSLHVNEQGVLHVSADTGEGAPYRESFVLSDMRIDSRAGAKAAAARAKTANTGRVPVRTSETQAASVASGAGTGGLVTGRFSGSSSIPVADGRMPGLLVASIALFVLSALELIAYFIIRVFRP